MPDSGTWDKVKGKAHETVGKMTHDKEQEAKGHAEQAKGRMKETREDIEEDQP